VQHGSDNGQETAHITHMARCRTVTRQHWH